MFEFHSWITIRETYEVRDDEEEGIEKVLQKVRDSIKLLNWNKPEIKARNGESYIEFSLFSNRKTEEIVELLDFFSHIANIAIGSYGIIYMLDDEDQNGKNNQFQVYSISRGKLHEQTDSFLSPFIPVVEDKDF